MANTDTVFERWGNLIRTASTLKDMSDYMIDIVQEMPPDSLRRVTLDLLMLIAAAQGDTEVAGRIIAMITAQGWSPPGRDLIQLLLATSFRAMCENEGLDPGNALDAIKEVHESGRGHARSNEEWAALVRSHAAK